MRKVSAMIAAPLTLVAGAGAAAVIWRRDPRIGTRFVNTVVDPLLLHQGLAGGAVSEIGTLEHVGRRSGVRRRTPVHPESTPEGFRIVVPLGPHSEWARNVFVAGHCRLQLHGIVYELDEPAMVPASAVHDLPWVIRRVMTALGFQYIKLRTFAENQGSLDAMDADPLGHDGPPSDEPSTLDPGVALSTRV